MLVYNYTLRYRGIGDFPDALLDQIENIPGVVITDDKFRRLELEIDDYWLNYFLNLASHYSNFLTVLENGSFESNTPVDYDTSQEPPTYVPDDNDPLLRTHANQPVVATNTEEEKEGGCGCGGSKASQTVTIKTASADGSEPARVFYPDGRVEEMSPNGNVNLNLEDNNNEVQEVEAIPVDDKVDINLPDNLP